MNEIQLEVEHVKAVSPLVVFIALLTAVFAGVLAIGGIYLAFAQRMAETKFHLFGNEFTSTSVGVSMAFVGAIVFVLTFRRILKLIEVAIKLPKTHD